MYKSKYQLEKYTGRNSRFDCLNCNKHKTFTRYINNETGEYIAPEVGKCDRESNCGYHLKPKDFFNQKGITYEPRVDFSWQKPEPVKPPSYIPKESFERTMKDYYKNNFTLYLDNLFGEELRKELVHKYHIGTAKLWYGATIFWQVDEKGKIRTGKIMLYNDKTGKRIKEPKKHFNWVHNFLKDFRHSQCLYGEHLLEQEPKKSVAIVESEKTAVIASVNFPEFVWLACGGLGNLNLLKNCQALQGRDVLLVPDLKGYNKWVKKANELKSILQVRVSDVLERIATDVEREAGLDLADYLLEDRYIEL
jgi:hypothetical protein